MNKKRRKNIRDKIYFEIDRKYKKLQKTKIIKEEKRRKGKDKRIQSSCMPANKGTAPESRANKNLQRPIKS